MVNAMADGKGCKCAARSESECGCDADWTPQELVDARAEISRLRLTATERNAIAWAAECFSVGSLPLSIHADLAATLSGLLDRLRHQ